MFYSRILPAIAVAGLITAALVAATYQVKTPVAQPVALPAQAPFASQIGGSGLVEASSTNISVGTTTGGIVTRVYVKAGDAVRAGDPLFQIDGRTLQAELMVKAADLSKSHASLAEATASLADYAAQYELVANLPDTRAVSVDDVQKRRNAKRLAEAKVQSANAALTYSMAEVASTQSAIAQLTVRAPTNAEVLQVNVHPGEYAATGSLSTALVMLGNLDKYYLRVDIDENDAWRFKKDTAAVAYMRGNRELKTDLKFVRVEPYVVPKTSLTGTSTEQVDTRVLQVLYSFDRNSLPAYVGQQMDVFIEAPDALERQAQSPATTKGA